MLIIILSLDIYMHAKNNISAIIFASPEKGKTKKIKNNGLTFVIIYD